MYFPQLFQVIYCNSLICETSDGDMQLSDLIGKHMTMWITSFSNPLQYRTISLCLCILWIVYEMMLKKIVEEVCSGLLKLYSSSWQTCFNCSSNNPLEMNSQKKRSSYLKELCIILEQLSE